MIVIECLYLVNIIPLSTEKEVSACSRLALFDFAYEEMTFIFFVSCGLLNTKQIEEM
jgi:hypothetical protein